RRRGFVGRLVRAQPKTPVATVAAQAAELLRRHGFCRQDAVARSRASEGQPVARVERQCARRIALLLRDGLQSFPVEATRPGEMTLGTRMTLAKVLEQATPLGGVGLSLGKPARQKLLRSCLCRIPLGIGIQRR